MAAFTYGGRVQGLHGRLDGLQSMKCLLPDRLQEKEAPSAELSLSIPILTFKTWGSGFVRV